MPPSGHTPASGAADYSDNYAEGDAVGSYTHPHLIKISQALETIETWRLDYNAVRPHSALGDVPPQEFEQLTLNRATAPILSS